MKGDITTLATTTMNYKILVSIAVFAAVGFVAISAANVALAYRGTELTGPNYTTERHAAMEKAFETGDYSGWKTLMQGRGRVTEVVTKENFAEFAKAHELTQQGKTAEADAIRQKLGISTATGTRHGMGRGKGGCGFGREQ